MQRYDSYKDSGIQWLGEIPSHWEVCKIKNVSQISSGSTPKSSIERYWGGGIKWITPADFKTDTKYVCKGMRDITEAGALSCSTKLIPKNSVVFSKRAPVGQVSITTDDLCINQGCIACIPNENIITPFFFYLLSCYKDEFESLSGGTTFKEIALNVFADFKISIPPLPEQQAIASYLDTVTAKIDEAIAQQQKMIDLLNERKQIIINNAVTKGLNPNAKMKPSGIDWIGNIPEHWEVTKLKSIGTTINGVSHDSSYFGEGSPFVSYSDVYKNRVLPQTVVGLAKSSKAEQKFFSVESGDVFFTRTSETVEEIGISSTCINTIPNAVFAGFLIRFRPVKGVLDSNFSSFYFRAQIHRSYFVKEMNLVIRASLSQQLLKGLPVLLPPVHEQVEIAQYLSQKTSMLEQAITAHNQQITLLQERKQIIINDVVTGKVKAV